MSPPDPTDLRLAAALAELGRTTVLQIAARAAVHPEEAAVRLLRMGAAGLPLVVGVEGDRAILHSWVAAQQLGGVPSTNPVAGWPSPQAGEPRGPQPQPPQPRPPQPRPPAQTPAPQQWPAAPIGWGVPQSAGWARQEPSPQDHSGASAGDALSSQSARGEPVTITLVEVVDTADALIAAAGHQLPPDTRAAVVHTEVTAGAGGYQHIPDTLLSVVLSDGTEVSKSGITLTSRPPFRSGVAPNDTVGGHTVFVLGAQVSIVGVRWRAGPDAPALDWRTA